MAGGRLYLHPIGTWADASITQVAGWLSVTGIVHQGMDYGVVHGTPVRAAAPGVVRRAIDGIPDNWTGDWRRGSSAWGGYGNHVLIDHPDGSYTLYAHLAPGSVAVQTGQRVATGQHLGLVGTSGYATGPHLHFELKHPPGYEPYDFRAELTDDHSLVEGEDWMDETITFMGQPVRVKVLNGDLQVEEREVTYREYLTLDAAGLIVRPVHLMSDHMGQMVDFGDGRGHMTVRDVLYAPFYHIDHVTHSPVAGEVPPHQHTVDGTAR